MATLNFNANDVPPAESFAPIPAGSYLGIITDSEIVPTKAGTGLMLNHTVELLEPPYKGRKVWGRINVQNQSEQAQRIGQQQLSQLCHAVGKLTIHDSSELHGIPLIVRVGFQRDDKERNEIKEYKSVTGSAATTSQPAAQTPAAAKTPAQASVVAGKASSSSAPGGVKPAWAK